MQNNKMLILTIKNKNVYFYLAYYLILFISIDHAFISIIYLFHNH